MKINTFSQNKLSFGVRKPFNDELKIDTLKQRIRSNVDLPPNTTRVHDLLFERILSAKGNQSLRCLFNQVKNGKGSNELKEALKKCKDNLKRIFWETCDRFFDVQLTKPGDKSRDDAERHIPDDYELTAIFPTERASHIDSRKDAIKFIDYYCSCYIEAKQKGEKLNKGKMFDSFLETRSNKVLKGTLLQYKTAIYNIYAHLDKIYKFTSLREFQEYILNKCNGENYTICRNETLFSHAFRKLKELKQKEAEIERVFHEDVKKKFIDYYCHCYFEAKQEGEELDEVKMFDSFIKTSSKKPQKSTLRVHNAAIKMIKAHLDESIGKTDEEFQEYIVKEYGGKTYTIIGNKELFSYAVGKLKELKQKMAEIESAPVPQEFVQPLPFNMVPQGVNYYPTNQPPLNYVTPYWENWGINHVPQNIQTETNAIDQRTIAPVPQEFVQPLPFNMVPQGVNYYPTNQPPLNYVTPYWENWGINHVPQNIQTETNATKQRANIKRPHESYDDAYSDKRRKM